MATGRPPGDIDDVFDANGKSGQRLARWSGIDRVGRRPDALRIEQDPRLNSWLAFGDPGETGIEPGASAKTAGGMLPKGVDHAEAGCAVGLDDHARPCRRFAVACSSTVPALVSMTTP